MWYFVWVTTLHTLVHGMNVFGKQSGFVFTGHLPITQSHDVEDTSFEVLYDF